MVGAEQQTLDHRRSLTGHMKQQDQEERNMKKEQRKKSIPRTGQKQVRYASSNTESKKSACFFVFF